MTSFTRKRRFYILSERQQQFIHSPWASGLVLILCSIVAIVLSNLDATKGFFHYLHTLRFSVGFENFELNHSLEEWVNDGLMAVFFFVVGLEIKREMIVGQLSTFKEAGLPVVAALGGMLVPAAVYLMFNSGTASEAGWGIPMATDIAFALGVVSLMGRKVPVSLKIFLTALAIVDDIGAILVIALFYSVSINWAMIIAAAAVFVLLIVLNRMGVYRLRYYLIPSVALWILFLHSGIHATISGVIIAMTIPSTARYSKKYFLYKTRYFLGGFVHEDRPGVEVLGNDYQHDCLESINKISQGAVSPSQRLEFSLHGMIVFFIMPVFALVNAGVEFDFSSFSELVNSESIGIYLGLVLGKPLGIFFFCWLTIKLGWFTMPKYATWQTLLGVACLGGIGFTMSIFINNLAFTDLSMIAVGKVSILLASVSAGLLGWLVISLSNRASRIN